MTGVPIVLQCGVDFWIQCVTTSDIDGSAVPITAPKMEIRGDSNSGAALLYSSQGGAPTIIVTQPSANVSVFSIASASTKNAVLGVSGSWDAVGTNAAGKVISLGSGTFRQIPNVTVL